MTRQNIFQIVNGIPNMLNFRNSGQGAGVGSMTIKKINPAYFWSFIGATVPANGSQGTVLIINDSISAIPLNYTNTGTGGTISQSTNSVSIGQNGANGKIALTASLPSALSTFTFSIWAKILSNGYAQRLLELFSSSVNTFQIDFNNNENFPRIYTTNGGSSGTIYPQNANSFLVANLQHICITVNDTNYQVYINGVSVLSRSTFPAAGMSSFFIANNDSNSKGCQCTVADIRIYNSVLSQTQITALYNANQDVNAVIPTTNFINLY